MARRPFSGPRIYRRARFAVPGSRHEGIHAEARSADGQGMEKLNTQLRLERSPTVTEYVRTLSVITTFCLSAFALAVVAGYLT